MLKILTAALVAATVLVAPLAASANAAQPRAKATVITTKVVKMKRHGRHVVAHRTHFKAARHVRGHKKDLVIRKSHHGKAAIRAHGHPHMAAKAHKTRAN